ncbi:hypothetical protein AKJ16_DCAP07194 [Drosera capensis]
MAAFDSNTYSPRNDENREAIHPLHRRRRCITHSPTAPPPPPKRWSSRQCCDWCFLETTHPSHREWY